MGARTLRKYIEQPLIEKQAITERLDAVEEFVGNAICREEIREYLTPVYDLERLVSKIVYKLMPVFSRSSASNCAIHIFPSDFAVRSLSTSS